MTRNLKVGLAIGLMLALGSLPAQAEVDKREMQAREAFGAGQYQTALDIFVKLYTEKLHPNYLRNIGRCYQNLGDPDKAISSFHEYLRKAKGVSADERAEVDGYIKEMEDLKRQREAATTTPPANQNPPGVITPLPSSGTGTVEAGAGGAPGAVAPPPTLTLTQPPPSPSATDESSPVYKKWWFWAIIGGVVAAGVGVAAATGAFTKTNNAGCPANVQCGG